MTRPASLHRFVRHQEVSAYLRMGWLALNSLDGTHHGEWSTHMVWLCHCEALEPRSVESVRLGPESLDEALAHDSIPPDLLPPEQIELDARPELTGPDKSITDGRASLPFDDLRDMPDFLRRTAAA